VVGARRGAVGVAGGWSFGREVCQWVRVWFGGVLLGVGCGCCVSVLTGSRFGLCDWIVGVCAFGLFFVGQWWLVGFWWCLCGVFGVWWGLVLVVCVAR